MDYVGIDLHKRESQICVIVGGTGEVIEKRIKTDRHRFAEVLPSLAPAGSKVVLEASTESAWAAPALEELGYVVIVADPNFAPMYGTAARKKRIKTDRRDARALAEACRAGTYRVAHRSSDKSRGRRNLLTTRDQLVRMRVNCIVTARSVLRQHGYAMPKGGAATSFADRVRSFALPKELAAVITPLLVTFDVLSAQIDGMDAQLKEIAASDPEVRRLMTAVGVGPVVAVAFQSAIDGPERFKNGHKVAAYLGLVPGENSSGDGQRRTSITKTGSSTVRWLLVQSALTIMRAGASKAPGLHKWGHAIAARRGSKVARVALARRLAGILFAMLRDSRDFEPQRFAPAA